MKIIKRNYYYYSECAFLIIIIINLSRNVNGHARMIEPPGRSSAWRFGYKTPVNYNDNQLFCGGYRNTAVHDGKCGICGDPYQGPWENEAGGKYATGTIVRYYDNDAHVINISIDVSAHHRGYFEFRICPNNDVEKRASHGCFEDNLLFVKEGKDQGDSTRYFPPKSGTFHLHLEIPSGLICSQCILQWKYTTGNFWGKDNGGDSCIGCGSQEMFVNCADIAIGDKSLYLLNNYTPSRNSTAVTSQYSEEEREGYDDGHNDKHEHNDNHKHEHNDNQTHHDHHYQHAVEHAHDSHPVLNTTEVVSKQPDECGRCYALPTWRHFPDMDNWCETNCKLGNCPPCRCYCGCPNLKFDNPCKGKDEYSEHQQMAGWCWRECCESECPKDKCSCSVSVKYPASSAYHVQKKFFDLPAIHLFPGSHIGMNHGNNHLTKAIQNESEETESEEEEPADDFNMSVSPPSSALLQTNLMSNFWHKQWIPLSGNIIPIDQVIHSHNELNNHTEHNDSRANISDRETNRSSYSETKSLENIIDHSAHALGVRKLPNEVLPVLSEFNDDNFLVSEVPERLLVPETKKEGIHTEVNKQTGSITSKIRNGIGIKNYMDNVQDRDRSVSSLSDISKHKIDIKKPTTLDPLPKHQKEKDRTKTQENEPHTLEVKLLSDEALIAKEDLNLDKLIKIVGDKQLHDKKHLYLTSGQKSNTNTETPYVVDVRLMNRILKSIKSWFDKPLYLVN